MIQRIEAYETVEYVNKRNKHIVASFRVCNDRTETTRVEIGGDYYEETAKDGNILVERCQINGNRFGYEIKYNSNGEVVGFDTIEGCYTPASTMSIVNTFYSKPDVGLALMALAIVRNENTNGEVAELENRKITHSRGVDALTDDQTYLSYFGRIKGALVVKEETGKLAMIPEEVKTYSVKDRDFVVSSKGVSPRNNYTAVRLAGKGFKTKEGTLPKLNSERTEQAIQIREDNLPLRAFVNGHRNPTPSEVEKLVDQINESLNRAETGDEE